MLIVYKRVQCNYSRLHADFRYIGSNFSARRKLQSVDGGSFRGDAYARRC